MSKVAPTSLDPEDILPSGPENNESAQQYKSNIEPTDFDTKFQMDKVEGDEGLFSTGLAKNAKENIIPDRSGETVFYDSAKAKRSCLGSFHYCVACPGWNKATNMRIVYSTWEWSSCCYLTVPCGRQLDTFDSDIIVDISAHQSCLQICRGEGDIQMWRLAGGDISTSSSEMFTMTDISNVFDVFSDMTFELAKMNLKDAATMGLGRRMGATLGYDPANNVGDATKDIKGEFVYYDSVSAKRTFCGSFMHLDCCLPPIYKLTSERVLHVEWDVWHPLDDPITSCIYFPFYFIRGVLRDICCGMGGGNRDNASKAAAARVADKAKDAERSFLNRSCVCPVGRTAHFFDLDIVVDIGAHQRCSQLLLNEGDLLLHRIGGDSSELSQIYKIKAVPEVFSKFDDISYELSKMELKSFRQNTVAQTIIR